VTASGGGGEPGPPKPSATPRAGIVGQCESSATPRAGIVGQCESSATPRVGVVGHVEWVEFARVARVPQPGEIVHALDAFSGPAGGGAVAAVQMRRLAGEAIFLTALGTGPEAQRTAAGLRALGVTVHAGERRQPQRRTFTFLDDDAERTITVLGERIVPARADPLPWDSLASLDAIYLTGGDAGAVRAARAARVLVATPRALPGLAEAGVTLDVLVGSAHDPGEVVEPGTLDPEPRVVVRTTGGDGGSWTARADEPDEPALPWLRTRQPPAAPLHGTWKAAPLPGPKVDAYGCGDAFAAALAYGLGAGMALDGAIALAARCGAAVLCGRGPYGAMLELDD
jgi:ribokinase